MKRLAVLLPVLLCSITGFAHGNVVDMTAASVNEGIAQLKIDHPEHLDHFQGIKAWPVAADKKLKIYLPDNAFVNYTCKHDDLLASVNKVKCTMEM